MVRFGVWGLWDLGCPSPHRGVLGSPLPMSEVLGSLLVRCGGLWVLGSPPTSEVLGSLLVRFGVWGLWDLGCPSPHRGVLGSPLPMSEVLGSLLVRCGGLWVLGSPPTSEVLGSLLVRFGVWGLWDLGCPPPHRGILGSPPPCQRSWGPCWSDLGVSGFWGPPMSEGQIWGALGFGVPPFQRVLGSLLVRFGVWGLWDLGSPPHSRGSQPPSLPYQRSRGPYSPTFGVSGFWGPPCPSLDAPGMWVLGSPIRHG